MFLAGPAMRPPKPREERNVAAANPEVVTDETTVVVR
jgi:hypothetical protein